MVAKMTCLKSEIVQLISLLLGHFLALKELVLNYRELESRNAHPNDLNKLVRNF